MRQLPFLLVLALAPACASAKPPSLPPPSPPSPAPSLVRADGSQTTPAPFATTTQGASTVAVTPSSSPVVVGWVAGTPLTLEDLLVEWHSIDGREVFLVLEKVVTKRLALAEAERLGVRLIPERVEMRIVTETARVKREVAQSGLDVSVEEFLEARFGVDSGTYFERMRLAVFHQMIVERAVRRWTLSNEWIRVRMILVRSAEDLAAVESELDGGAEFAAVAKVWSLDDSAENGGLIAFLVNEGASPLATAAFAVEPGQVAGPIEVSGHRVLLLVEERHAPLEGDWDAVGEAVERSIEAHPVEDSEFLYWKLTMEERYPIDVTALREILGIGQ